MLRKTSALLALWALLASPALGFDTFWHSTCTQQVGQQFGFTEDARNVMQLGNFSPDFFGPVSEYAAENLKNNPAMGALNQEVLSENEVRQSAIFLHFDNLGGALSKNSNFDYIFNQLLHSTQSLLADFRTRKDLDDNTRKAVILITLGASLHAVQDFYSHSDWIHNDFNQTKAKLVALPDGAQRAPTWFEFRDQMGNPDKWPFQIKTGIYPPLAGAVNTHTHMNHDNSRLLYREYENPGQPLVSQAKFHAAGPAPAQEQDAASIMRHQQMAVNTAMAASTEWVKKVEENSGAKAAIEYAKTWDLKSTNAKLFHELEAGLAVQTAISCAAGKWDGENPPAEKAALCRTLLESKVNPVATGNQGGWLGKVLGTVAGLGMPVALRYTGRFWAVHSKYNLLGHLAEGIAGGGQYKFAQK
ncbi:MAG TPA: hypothetical protein VFA76_01115 [Terriglobales bacterium]|nr:hypothetical protein [Terriglobales bacterium]